MNTPTRARVLQNQLVTPKREIVGVMPSPLLRSPTTPRYIPRPSSLTDLDTKFPALEERDEMFGKAGIVYLATSNPGKQTVAIKRQILSDPLDKENIAYRELQIMQELNQKIKGNHNFIKLLDWNKCWVEATPPRYSNSNSKKENVQCMNIVMKQAGEPLQNLVGKDKTVSSYLFKTILFQVLFSLAKAQKACEFMHNDLHLKNILIDLPQRSLIAKYHEYKDEDNVWYVDSKIVVTIVDFGLSRITKEDGTVVHNDVHPVFMPSADVDHLSTQFNKFKITSWLKNYDTKFSKEEEKEEKKLKRSLLQRMRNFGNPASLINHPFFNSMQERPTLPSDLIIPSPTNLETTKPKTSNQESLQRRCSLPPSPMSSMLAKKFSQTTKTCLPNPKIQLTKFSAAAQKLPSSIAITTKELVSVLTDKENITNKATAVLTKRKRQGNNNKQQSKRRKL